MKSQRMSFVISAEQVHALNGNEHSQRGEVIVIEDEKSHETGTEKSEAKDTKHGSSHSRHGHKSKKVRNSSLVSSGQLSALKL